MSKRIEQLDSLRGIAALTVLVGHFLNVYSIIHDPSPILSSNIGLLLIKYTPLRIIRAGTEAVIMFFILSGFVLAMQFLNENQKVKYPNYLIKRYCRIYIPYIMAVFFALIAQYLFYGNGINELSSWFNNRGTTPINKGLILQHVIFLGYFKNCDYNPVLWSLVHEMRISIIFPFIMVLINKLNWKSNLIIGFSLGVITSVGNKIIPLNIRGDYLDTLKYIGIFMLGALLAKYKDNIIRKYKEMKQKNRFMLLIIALFFYTASMKLPINFLRIWGVGLAASVFIIEALSSEFIKNILLSKFPIYIGKISYSLYLYHCICLISLIYILYGIIPVWGILIIALFTSLIIATLSYYFIELPSIKLGRHIVNKINKEIEV